MKFLTILADISSDMDIDVEIVTFLCSFLLYAILQSVCKPHKERKRPGISKINMKLNTIWEGHDELDNSAKNEECGADNQSARYSEMDKSLHVAFEAEDYWQVLNCWGALKKLKQCPPVHLSQIVKSMQCCNKGAHFIVSELRDYFKAFPQKRNICLINDILEPLARRSDDSQLVDLIVRMLPSIHLVKDSRTYEILLTMHVAKKSLAKAQEIIAEMRTNKVAFTPCATVAVLTIALQVNNLDVAMKAFNQLKASWDVRSTWAVSPFALQHHKTGILTQIVELACRNRRLGEALAILDGMAVPDEVMNVVRSECASLSDIELVAVFKPVAKSGQAQNEDSMCAMLMNSLDRRARASLRAAMGGCDDGTDASTSEGSKSDSEVSEEGSCFGGFRPPPGLSLED